VLVGILGSGLMGGKLGTVLARAGHEVIFSYARSKEKLKRLARAAGPNARAGTPAEAARDADALVLAVRWLQVADVLHQAGDLSGKVVLSCALPMMPTTPSLLSATPPQAWRNWRKSSRRRTSRRRSTACRARSFSACIKRDAEPTGRASFTVAMTGAPRCSPPPSSATPVSIRSMPAPRGSPALSSHSRFSSPNSLTKAKVVRNWRTGGCGSADRGPGRRRSSFG
jgi:hypothetical protein